MNDALSNDDADTCQALFEPFEQGLLAMPPDHRVLFLGANPSPPLRRHAQPRWTLQQDVRPVADALQAQGYTSRTGIDGTDFGGVLILPARQRQAWRGQLVAALDAVTAGGWILAAASNTQGARSMQSDMRVLLGPVDHRSTRKCRVAWRSVDPSQVDSALAATWRAADAPQKRVDGYVSRPGLFAWDRVDAASALLAAQLPPDLAGTVADLGAGYGFLATQVIARCPGVQAIDLYEADARALASATANVEAALAKAGRDVRFAVHWHDVTAGLPARYDAMVSNPPFHQGRVDAPQLGQAFIRAAADALAPHGSLWLVANRHLPYEATLAERFAHVHTLVQRDGFKVIAARGVRG